MHHNDESIHIVSPALPGRPRRWERRSDRLASVRRDRCRVRPSPSRRAWTIRASAGRVLAGVVVTALLVTTAGPWRPADGAPRGPAERAGASVGHVGPYETAERRAPTLIAAHERFVFYSRTNPAVGIGNTGSSFSPYLQLDQASARRAAGYFYDGGLWASSSSVETTSDWTGTDDVVPAGRALVLPKGIYAVSAYLDHEGDMGNGSITLTWYSASPVVGDELGQPPYYLPGFPGGAVATGHDGFVANGILAHFSDTPVPFLFSFSAYPQIPGVTIQDYSIMVQKISNVA